LTLKAKTITNLWMLPQITQRPLPSIALPIYVSLHTIKFDAMYSRLLRTLLNETEINK